MLSMKPKEMFSCVMAMKNILIVVFKKKCNCFGILSLLLKFCRVFTNLSRKLGW